MHKLILTYLLFTLIPGSIFAQDWFSKHALNERVPGYIIGIAGDTLDRVDELIKAQVVWAVREEMARTLEDCLSRRIRAMFDRR